jgi:putative resolvase
MTKVYKLSEYAKRNGVTYRTAWTHFNEGKIEGAFKNEYGRVFIPEDETPTNNNAVVYARVSSNDRKPSLIEQQKRIEEFVALKGLNLIASYREVASGMNDDRTVLNRIIDDERWTYLVIENKDRLTRFGFNYLKKLLAKRGKEIIVMHVTDDDKQDLMKDLISIIYSFSARLYSIRRRKEKKKIIEFLESEA